MVDLLAPRPLRRWDRLAFWSKCTLPKAGRPGPHLGAKRLWRLRSAI